MSEACTTQMADVLSLGLPLRRFIFLGGFKSTVGFQALHLSPQYAPLGGEISDSSSPRVKVRRLLFPNSMPCKPCINPISLPPGSNNIISLQNRSLDNLNLLNRPILRRRPYQPHPFDNTHTPRNPSKNCMFPI